MIHAAAASQGINLQARQSLIAGIGLTCEEKESVASTAAVTGRLPARHLLYEQLEELDNEEWTGLFHIAVTMICYDTNRELQFEKARSALISSRQSPQLHSQTRAQLHFEHNYTLGGNL